MIPFEENTHSSTTDIDTAVNEQDTYDVVVVGGGINGVSMLLEACSRGLKSLLIQSDDLAEGASANPTALVGGNLRQLEDFCFADVKSNFDELAIAQQRAPHLVRPIPVLPLNNPEARSRSRLRTGIYVYNKLTNKKLKYKIAIAPQLELLRDPSDFLGIQFTECLTKQARMIIAIAQQATLRGAKILPHHKVTSATRGKKLWQLGTCAKSTNENSLISARWLINCSGCFTNTFLDQTLHVKTRAKARVLVSGQLFIKAKQAWRTAAMMQLGDKSLVSASPFGDQICIEPIVAEDESEEAKDTAIEQVIEQWNRYFKQQLTRDNITHCRWSLTASSDSLNESPKEITECLLDLNNPGNAAPLLSLFGLDTVKHRRFAEQGLDILEVFTDSPKIKYETESTLPGGHFPGGDIHAFTQELELAHPYIEKTLIQRWVRTYGSQTTKLLSEVRKLDDLGEHIGQGLYEAEVEYLVNNEWVCDAQSILWRRTYLGMKFSDEQITRLEARF